MPPATSGGDRSGLRSRVSRNPSHAAGANDALRGIVDLYSTGSHTFKSLADQPEHEGHTFRKSQPRFHRTALSYILKNRFYIGELRRNGQVFEGKYERLIQRSMFDECRDVLCGRNRRTGKPRLTFAGGSFNCAYCGHAITGEVIRRKLRGGGVREHVYYRCANNDRGPNHPKLRWKAADLERLVANDLVQLQFQTLVSRSTFAPRSWPRSMTYRPTSGSRPPN